MRTVAIVSAVLIAGGVFSTAKPAQCEFTARGMMRLSYYYTSEATVGQVEDAQFEAEFKNDRWFITTRKLRAAYVDPVVASKVEQMVQKFTTNGVLRTRQTTFETGFDGSAIYSFEDVGGSLPPADAVIRKGPVPYNDRRSYATPIWLALASWSYFDANGAPQTKPLWPLEDVEGLWYQNVLLPVEIVRDERAPGILKSLRQQSSGENYKIVSGSQPNVLTNYSYRPPFDQGFTKCRYVLISTTNVGNWVFPHEFRFEVFLPKPNGKSADDTRLSLSYDGTVDYYALSAKREDFRPIFNNQKPIVVDRRYSSDSNPAAFALFLARDSKWPDADDPDLEQQAIKRSQAMAALKNTSTSAQPWLIRIILINAVIVPFALGLWMHLRRKRAASQS